MTKEDVFSMVSEKSPEDLSSSYTKKVLTEMYICLYGISPASSKRRCDLAWSIWKFIADEKRVADLCKFLLWVN